MSTLCPELVISLIYIINYGHNVRMKKRITSFTVTKVSEAREQIHIFSNSVSNTVNMSLPFKLVIKNDDVLKLALLPVNSI